MCCFLSSGLSGGDPVVLFFLPTFPVVESFSSTFVLTFGDFLLLLAFSVLFEVLFSFSDRLISFSPTPSLLFFFGVVGDVPIQNNPGIATTKKVNL